MPLRPWFRRHRANETEARWPVLAWAGVAATLILQITYPLVDSPAANQNPTLRTVTITTVLAFAATSWAHCASWLGRIRATAVLVIIATLGLIAEIVGTHTGWLFGPYSYTGLLGPQVTKVPLLIGLAWFMMAWPSYVIGHWAARQLRPYLPPRVNPIALGTGLAAWLLASWDLYLDPQMVAAGYWTWHGSFPHLPGLPQIPAANFLGWLAVAVVIQSALTLMCRGARWRSGHYIAVPAVLIGWTWCGGALAHLVWLGHPVAAAYGWCAYALVLLPALLIGFAKPPKKLRGKPATATRRVL